MSAVAGPVASQPDTYSISEITDHIRSAQRIDEFRKSGTPLTFRGNANYGGITEEYTAHLGPDGRFDQAISGTINLACGYDGTNVWEVDATGAPQKLFGESGDACSLTFAVLTGSWLDANSEFELKIQKVLKDSPTIELLVKPKASPIWSRLQIDTKTWLPARLEYHFRGDWIVTTYTNWRQTGSAMLPGSFLVDGGLPAMSMGVEINRQTSGPYSFSIPMWKAEDTKFDRAAPPDVEMRKTLDGHILVHPTISGKDVGWFLLDTGCSAMVLDQATAKELGLIPALKSVVQGVGGSQEGGSGAKADFGLGPVSIKNLRFATFDLSGVSQGLFMKIAGIVGYDFFRRTVVDLDYQHRKVAVYDPSAYTSESEGWLKLAMDDGCPLVEAQFEGNRRGFFEVDIGSKQTMFCSPAVDRLKLLRNRKTEPSSMLGLGGISEAATGKLKWISIGPCKFEDFDAVFSRSQKGIYANGFWTGSVGVDLLTEANVIFDYSNDRVLFTKVQPPKPGP